MLFATISFPSDCTNSAQKSHYVPPHVTTVYYYLPLDTFYGTLKRFLVRLVCVPSFNLMLPEKCHFEESGRKVNIYSTWSILWKWREQPKTQPTHEWDISPARWILVWAFYEFWSGFSLSAVERFRFSIWMMENLLSVSWFFSFRGSFCFIYVTFFQYQ